MSKKVPVSIRAELEVIVRLRNAVWHLGRGLTVTAVIEEALDQGRPRPGEIQPRQAVPERGTPLPKASRKK